MYFPLALFLVLLLSPISLVYCEFMNEFAVELKDGSVREEVKNDLEKAGFTFHRQIGPLSSFLLFSHNEVPHRSRREADKHTAHLADHPQIGWVEQQKVLQRQKRGIIPADRGRAYSKLVQSFDDPLWGKEWYMWDKEHASGPTTRVDLHIAAVWDHGITGKGVRVTILDDGLEWNHTDIWNNYDPQGSGDINDHDDDPFPRYDPTNENRHGTRCAGVIAMKHNNGKCGVGIAPGALVGGVRMLDGPVNDRVEAESIGFALHHVDVFSASWGPTDDGMTVDGPGRLSEAAFERGISMGRQGKGAIYVWASGNGGRRGDNCNCDGYTSSPYTVSISSASEHGRTPAYVEHCSSTLATTYSSGSYMDHNIISTDLHNQCTNSFTGTSAAAPLGAGIMALLLERNPDLTWRDVQHLITWTSEPYALWNNPGWKTNKAGFLVNSRFGFGLLDARALVAAANPSKWLLVGPRHRCTVRTTDEARLPVSVSSNGQTAVFKIQTRDCVGDEETIEYLEHIQVIMDIQYSRRGALNINVTSPQGTTTSLLNPRSGDYSTKGFKAWPFMSVHTWGENPSGEWTVTVEDNQGPGALGPHRGQVNSVQLVMWGLSEMPEYIKNSPGQIRTYDTNYDSSSPAQVESGSEDPFLSLLLSSG